MTTFIESLERSRRGNVKLDTPEAASDLYYILLKRYEEPNETTRIQLRYVTYGLIEFRVNVTVFRFEYKVGYNCSFRYRHMEGDNWHEARFFPKIKDPIKLILNYVSRFGFDEPPSPISK